MEQEVQILFKPKAGKLKQIYPELAENKKFKDLQSDELLFVWYYASASSPIDPEISDKIRAVTAAYEAIKDKDKKQKYSNLEFPERMKEAIEEMKKYNPDVRMIAKRIIQNAFKNLEAMSNVDIKEFKKFNKDGDEEIDWSGRKQHVDTLAKISETLPGLIVQMEQGFGILDEKGKENTKKAIDRFHENKTE